MGAGVERSTESRLKPLLRKRGSHRAEKHSAFRRMQLTPAINQQTSNKPAAPIPMPTHMVTTTYFTPRRLPSISA